jgi:hypothetical protein
VTSARDRDLPPDLHASDPNELIEVSLSLAIRLKFSPHVIFAGKPSRTLDLTNPHRPPATLGPTGRVSILGRGPLAPLNPAGRG